MEIEDGIGQIRVVLSHCQNLECSGVKELYRKCTINTYVCVIGMVKEEMLPAIIGGRTIIAAIVAPFSSLSSTATR